MKPTKEKATPKLTVPSLGRRGMSLCINELLMIAAAESNPMAIAICESWKFNIPVILMDATEYDRKLKLGWGS